MNNTLIQMTLIMLCGAGWQWFCPGGLSASQTRHALTTVVYYFFLPAMILDVLWRAEMGWQSLTYSALGGCAILSGIGMAWLVATLCRFKAPQTGTMILAAAFANVTYLGLPVLEETFGLWARSVVIQIDLFSASPLVFTLGILLAKHYGANSEPPRMPLAFLNTPPFWACFIATLLNVYQIPAPLWLAGLLQKLSAAVSPLMLFALGLALNLRAVNLHHLPTILPIAAIKLWLIPWGIFHLAAYSPLDKAHQMATVMDLAMPSMVVGVILCDRYRLDTELYAMAVTVTTGLSLISLPLWYGYLQAV